MSTLVHLKFATLPRSLVWDGPLPDEELEALCAANDSIQFERTRDGEIRMNPPTELLTSDSNVEIIYQLRAWWKTHRRGRVADSNAGFHLPDGAMLSPDAAYITPKRMATVPRGKRGFPYVCPNFVVELLSRSDIRRKTQQKMQDWIDNGVELGWLVDPYKQEVVVYRPGLEPEIVTGDAIHGSGPLEGFTLDLAEVWRCYDE